MPILGIVSSSIEIPAAGAFESIASATGTGSSATVTFSSIPADYQHLHLRILAKASGTTGAARKLSFRFNGITSSTYNHHNLKSNGNSVTAAGFTGTNLIGNQLTFAVDSLAGFANMFGVAILDIHDYASTTKNTTTRFVAGHHTNDVGGRSIGLESGAFRSTNAINSLSIIVDTGNFESTSRFDLYGIRAA